MGSGQPNPIRADQAGLAGGRVCRRLVAGPAYDQPPNPDWGQGWAGEGPKMVGRLAPPPGQTPVQLPVQFAYYPFII